MAGGLNENRLKFVGSNVSADMSHTVTIPFCRTRKFLYFSSPCLRALKIKLGFHFDGDAGYNTRPSFVGQVTSRIVSGIQRPFNNNGPLRTRTYLALFAKGARCVFMKFKPFAVQRELSKFFQQKYKSQFSFFSTCFTILNRFWSNFEGLFWNYLHNGLRSFMRMRWAVDEISAKYCYSVITIVLMRVWGNSFQKIKIPRNWLKINKFYKKKV